MRMQTIGYWSTELRLINQTVLLKYLMGTNIMGTLTPFAWTSQSDTWFGQVLWPRFQVKLINNLHGLHSSSVTALTVEPFKSCLWCAWLDASCLRCDLNWVYTALPYRNCFCGRNTHEMGHLGQLMLPNAHPNQNEWRHLIDNYTNFQFARLLAQDLRQTHQTS